MHVNFVLIAELLLEVVEKPVRREECLQVIGLLEGDFVAFRNHTQECVNSLRDLVLGTRDADQIARLFGAGKVDLAVPFLL